MYFDILSIFGANGSKQKKTIQDQNRVIVYKMMMVMMMMMMFLFVGLGVPCDQHIN